MRFRILNSKGSLGLIGILISPAELRRSILAFSSAEISLSGIEHAEQNAFSTPSIFHSPQFLHFTSRCMFS